MTDVPRPCRRHRKPGFHRALAGVVLLATVAATPATTAEAAGETGGHGPLRWSVQHEPFHLTFLRHGKPFLAQSADDTAGPGGRMAYQVADGSTHRLTDVVRSEKSRDATTYDVGTDEAGRTARVTVRTTPRGLRVEWRFEPATGVTQVYESLTGDDAEHFLGGGAHAIFTDLRHRVILNKAYFTGSGPLSRCNKTGLPSPFFLSSRGYGVFPETDVIGRIAFPDAVDDPPHCADNPPPCPVRLGRPDRTQLCFKAARLDYEVYSGSPSQVVRAYSAKAGLPTLPPVRQFALTHWRDTVADQATVVDDVKQMVSRGIPMATEWIDNPWETSTKLPGESQNSRYACNGTLTFDPVQFPDPKKMVEDLKAMGVHLGIWISPHVRTQAAERPCPATDYPPGSFIRTSRTDPLQLDLTNPATLAHFKAKLEKLFSLGIDMVKGDRGEEFELEDATFAAGSGVDLMNTNPVRYAQATADVLRKVHGDEYTMLWRGGYTGLPSIVNGVWGGDPQANFDGLRLSVRKGLTSWLTGHPVWGTDTGGFNGGPSGYPSPTLFTRWSQFSAVSPVFEVGGAGRNATPWKYDDKTVQRFKDNVLLHYALFPYLYGLARHSARTGEPITRPMGYDFPSDEQAWTADQHMMIGKDLLAVPVTADRNETDAAAGVPTPVEVYLPAGRWTDLHTGVTIDGGERFVRESTLDDFPLYLRAGAAIGFNRRIEGVWPREWGTNDLDRRDRSSWLYAPGDGPTYTTSPTGGTLFAHGDRKTITLAVTGAPAETQVMVTTRDKPARVLIDGRPVAETTGPLAGSATGWTTKPGPFGGLLLKLDPRAGFSTATITLG